MDQLLSVMIFMGMGLVFVFANMLVGSFLRPTLDNAEKKAIYECGEPTIGSSWVQFDLRFYIVALFFLVFDVEVALMYPWATVFRQYPMESLIVGLPFLAVVVVGYVYEWYAGSLDWVRSSVNTSFPAHAAGAGATMATLARRDPEALEDEAAKH